MGHPPGRRRGGRRLGTPAVRARRRTNDAPILCGRTAPVNELPALTTAFPLIYTFIHETRRRPPSAGPLCRALVMAIPPRVLHLDVDSFFAAVEQRDDARLRGRPVAVGSGVVASCS